MAEDNNIPASPSVAVETPRNVEGLSSKENTTQEFYVRSSLLNLGLDEKKVRFLLDQGKRFLENPNILSRRLGISEPLAMEAIKILKCSKPDSEIEIPQAELEKIRECLIKHSDLESHEEIALMSDVDERFISKYFEMLPLSDKQKLFIEERYNKDISLSEIANLSNIGTNKVREYVEMTFATFSGEEGSKVLNVIHKHFGVIPIYSLREKIRSKNLKLQDQLCCILPRNNKEEFRILMNYFHKYEESKDFLTVDLNLSMDDIGVIKQSGKYDVGQLSTKLNKVESIISDYIHQYSVYHIEKVYYENEQANQISEIAQAFGANTFSFDNYRMIITHSFDEMISRVEKLREAMGLLDLIPLVFYYLKCSLPFEDIARIIANLSKIILTTHDVFHLIFQLSDSVLKGLCIEHYSFSNAVPLYYPKLKPADKFNNTEFEICKELWYCLEQYNGLISFGLGRASWNAVGKSALLDLMFETDFVKGSPQGSAFHFRSIDIQITKNLFGELNRSSLESTDWAYIDCHGYSNLDVIHSMCSHLDLALIHVNYHDYKNNKSELYEDLSRFESKMRHIYLLIRDADCVEVSVSHEGGTGSHKTIVFIPDLTKKDIKIHSIVKSLKEIGHEIFHLEIEQPKLIQSQFVEAMLLETNHTTVEEVQSENALIQKIIHHIDTTTTGNKIDFKFLNFYPSYMEYMSLYHQASYETDQQLIDTLNIDCARLEEKMKNILIGEIVVYFNQILQRENSTLVLWKLSRELSRLSKRFTSEKRDANESLKEQRNDKYSLEIIWREALLSHKYGQTNICKENYGELLASNFSKHVESGEAFELIDGDNLRFFNRDIDTLLCKFYIKHSEMLGKINEGKNIELKQAPIVVSIFGPQSSGKSTLLNYCFGCKFLTSAGRCTRGIYGSLSKLDRPINLSQFFLILDTEGLDAIERENIKDTSMIHFDRTMVLFCLSVSQVVIINVKGGDIGSEMQNLLQMCAYSLNRLKVNKVKAPKIFFVLNQQADPDPNKHLDSINLLMDKLNSESSLIETEGVKICELIQVSRDNLFILPSAFNSQQINKPGVKLFDYNVIKLSPTIAFAEKCANLRVAIVDQLDRMALDDRAPFQTMSEWMEMAGVIWDTIIKYQDIVKFRNLEELACTNKLSKIVTDLTDKYIYSNQDKFAVLTTELCKEIDLIKSYIHPDTILSKYMIKFDEVFTEYQDCCLREFSLKCKDSHLDKMEHIRIETASNLRRLIYVVRKQYEDQLKLQIKLVLTEIRLSESMKNFQEAIIKNVDRYLEFDIEEQKKAFEETWDKTFGFEDQEEETRECRENFSNLYSIFKMEYYSMERKQKILEIFNSQNFNMNEIIQTIESDMLYRFYNVTKFTKSDQLIYPIHNYHIPIKEMVPYNGRSKFDYLCQDSLYKLENRTEGILELFGKDPYFPYQTEETCLWNIHKYTQKPKLAPLPWIPIECNSLVNYCSGLVSHPDITWKYSKITQIGILASSLRNPDHLGKSTWEKFLKDISSDVLKLLESNPDVSHAVVKQIIHDFRFRIKLLNYEIGYILAGLSNTAEGTLSTFVFAYAFNFLWEKKALVRKENKEKKDAQKPGHLRYFLVKIGNRRMVRGSWNRDSMAVSDKTFSQKYALDFIASVKRGLIHFEQQNYMKMFFEERRESLSHNSLLSLAYDEISKLLVDPDHEVTDIKNFVVQFVCNRTQLFKEIFQKKWRELEQILFQTISESIARGYKEKVSILKDTLRNLISQLEANAESLNFKAFDSDSNFEIVEFGNQNLAEVKEIPFKAMTKFLQMYLDPTLNPEEFKRYYHTVFVKGGFKVRRSDTYALCPKPSEPSLDADTFNKLVKTGMFNANDLIFNLYDYVRQFFSVLEGYQVALEQDEFQEMVYPLKGEFEKDAVGCPSQCPGCGKFCEREIHPNDGKCQIRTGHQISSMGGKVWNTDKDKTAVLFMCDDYKDHTYVIMPCGNMKWREFKDTCDSQWNWEIPNNEAHLPKQLSNNNTMKHIWNKFGRGILEYYHQTEGTRITFVPYTTSEEICLKSISLKYFICFVIDGTGSMNLDISRVRVSVGQLIKHFTSRGSSAEFRVVIYRDHCDENIIETYPGANAFTPDQKRVEDYLSRVVATGGGDFPEAMLDGLATAATKSDWKCTPDVRNKVIHIFNSPPHGNFPNYESHSSYSNKSNCCCCNQGNLCPFDWKRDVWEAFSNYNIEYHAIHTKSSKWESYTDVYKTIKNKAMECYHWIDIDMILSKYMGKMNVELGHLCRDFRVVGKEVVNDAILQIFVDFKK